MGMLLLVRHGQASFGADDYDVLSDLGQAQATRLGEHLGAEGVVPTAVVHGSLRRQAGTARAVAAAAGWDVALETDPRWDEFDHLAVLASYGEGVAMSGDRRDFQKAFEAATSRWQAESPDWVDFTDRTAAALRDAAARAGRGQTVVAVTSGGVIAAVASALVGGTPASWQQLNAVTVNASVTRVLVGQTGPRLLTFNEHGWFAPEQVTYR